MKMYTRWLAMVMAFVMIFTTPVFAAGEVAPRESSFFARSSVYLHKTSTLTFQAWFDVTGTDAMQEIGARTIKIQRSPDGETWTDMKTFSRDSYPNLICNNTATHAACVTYTGTPGYYYRAYIVLYAKDSTGSAEWYRYTTAIQL